MSQPPALLFQQCVPSVPSSDELQEAALWNYSFTFQFADSTPFEVTFNGKQIVSAEIALEEADGIAQIRVTASSDALPVVLIPGTDLVPTEGAYRYRKSDGTMLTLGEAMAIPDRTVVFQRMHVLHVQSARASVQGACFAAPLVPLVENTARIEIGGGPATLAQHLTSLLQRLLGDSPFASQSLGIECRYGYDLGGVPIEAPVLLVVRQDVAIGFDDQLVEHSAGAIRQWLDAVQPAQAGARLILTLTFWSSTAPSDAPLLRLTNVSLAMSDVIR